MRLGILSEGINHRGTMARTSHGEETKMMAWDGTPENALRVVLLAMSCHGQSRC